MSFADEVERVFTVAVYRQGNYSFTLPNPQLGIRLYVEWDERQVGIELYRVHALVGEIVLHNLQGSTVNHTAQEVQFSGDNATVILSRDATWRVEG